MSSAHAYDQVKQHWFSLVQQADGDQAARCWHGLVQAYTQPNRHYHTLEHLAHLLLLYSRYQQSIEKKEVVLFAIFYHDYVYDPARTGNEENSARKAGEVLRLLAYPDGLISAVARFIRATRAHHSILSADNDLLLFLDFDLAILGAPLPAYEQYRQNIRREYTIYTDETFYNNRCAFLKKLLRLPSIFRSPQLKELEPVARQNLQREAAQFCP